MAKSTTNGQCLFCKGTFSKQAMARHLVACEKRKSFEKASASPRRVFHLFVEGRYAPEYWIHLEAETNATLQDLDGLLRDLWLECCGHLSAFTIAGQTYSSSVMDEFGDKNMNAPLGKVLYPKMKFSHEYDFGTTTDLTLKIVAARESAIKRGDIILMNFYLQEVNGYTIFHSNQKTESYAHNPSHRRQPVHLPRLFLDSLFDKSAGRLAGECSVWLHRFPARSYKTGRANSPRCRFRR
ncbi:hypothetical protein L0244_17380 [bacterium]|nr:hypothetical protein [bacterium]MCI0691271.1 hypothetical protein [candidate division KSB1 bacterium]